jgi:hypothetical protein
LDTTYLAELLASTASPLAAGDIPDRFFTMLATMAEYRQRGARYEQFNLSSTSLAVELPRDNVPALEMMFQFDHEGVLPKRMAVVIGKNGVGKSRTLRQWIASAAAPTARASPAPRHSAPLPANEGLRTPGPPTAV